MGFRAPSADKIYRYALRLDSTGGLVDRFGWSIVVLNDSSAASRQFLSRYCVDLCVRTADRVRFVFFSDLSVGAFTAAMWEGHDGPLRGSKLGVIGPVLDSIARLDFERDPWRQLRPAALRPFVDLGEIDEQIGWECSEKAAMPGSGEALRFAQRLGIGAQVPCILVFTDIGALTVHVLPFEGASPDQIFERVRGWIDDFYAENRAALARWQSVEDDIARLAEQSRSTLRAVRGWQHSRRNAWNDLRNALGAKRALADGPEAGLAELQRIVTDYHIPWRFRNRVIELAADFEAVVRPSAAVLELRRRAVKLPAHTEPKRIRAQLREIERRSELLGPVSRAAVAEASAALRNSRSAHPPRDRLFRWWRGTVLTLLSNRQFRRQRLQWTPSEPTDAHAQLRTRDRLRIEYGVFREAVGGCRVTAGAETIADCAFSALAAFHEIPEGSSAWIAATSGHRQNLVASLGRLRWGVPRWLEGLPIGECVPLGRPADPDSFEAFIRSQPRLLAVVESEAARWSEAEETHARHRDRVAEALRMELTPPTPAAAVEKLRQALAEVHAEMLADARARALADDSADLPETDLASVPLLAESLDEYDAAVARISFPHLRDPLLVPVPTELSPAEAAGAERHPPRPGPSERLAEAVATTRQAYDMMTRAEADRSRRAAVLSGVVGPARLPALLTAGGDQAPFETLVERLDADELNALRQALDGRNHVAARVSAASPTRFDVFMAHNSADKPAVLDLCRRLRDRGLKPWIDVEQIPPGRWFSDVIQSAVLKSDAAAVCIGPASVGRWQALEIRTFLEQCVERQVPVIPVLLPGADRIPAELVFLRNLHHVRFTDHLDEPAALNDLVWGIRGHKP
uniref:toll/interleukin-1 receptor domain-containing protein n=1 Tax=Paractinoplanes polyasparticus TaxID=2856853 RepID=UPI001C842027|nr:toll/interleukin-1 receptor domain-containing protein [Actinoplanes polyasparticus]